MACGSGIGRGSLAARKRGTCPCTKKNAAQHPQEADACQQPPSARYTRFNVTTFLSISRMSRIITVVECYNSV
ncbi:hypothetical protein ANTQUA_LOCUS1932 [Anthophora quadrimaculata]